MVHNAQIDTLVDAQPLDDGTDRADQTIVAVATVPGKSGIGVIRISGERAEEIGNRIVDQPLSAARISLRKFCDPEGRAIDEGMALLFKAPRSYTGEDVCELQCHGSPIVQAVLLETVVGHGARLAEPGEYTRRAFANGKIDLAQAEAVADLIASSTESAARSAMRSLTGEFSRHIEKISDELMRLRVHVEAAIDFPEDEVDLLAEANLTRAIATVADDLARLDRLADKGVLLREGAKVAIAGLPNAGKSSLLNRFAGESRAIVAATPGTTRDTIEITININGLAVQIIDTAGVRDTDDAIEAQGVERAWKTMRDADLVLYVIDAQRGLRPYDKTNLASLAGSKAIVVWSKIDIADGKRAPNESMEFPQVSVSAKKGDGFDELRERMASSAGAEFDDGVFLARRRHLESIREAREALDQARVLLNNRLVGDLMAEDLRQAQLALGAITGQVSTEDLLGEIFSSFCIGK